MFYFAGIFWKGSFAVSLGGIYLENSRVWYTRYHGLSREPVTMPAKAWRNGIKGLSERWGRSCFLIYYFGTVVLFAFIEN